MFFKKILMCCLLFLTLVISINNSSTSQEIQAISAIVNDEVISRYDVQQRIKLIIVTSGIQPTQENVSRLEKQAIRALVNEKIQLQEAIKLDVPTSSEEVDLMLRRIASGNEMSSEEIINFISSNGVNSDTLLNQIKAELLWNKIVRGRFGSYINISEDEISIVYNRTIESLDREQYDISEIFLGFESKEEEVDALNLAERLIEQLKNGASFAPVAQQFSQASSSGQGGYIGWVSEGQLNSRIVGALKRLSNKQISNPIKTVNGFYIVRLNEKAEAGGKNYMRNQYDLISITFDKDRKKEAQNFSNDFISCKRLDNLIEKYQESKVNLIGKRFLSELPTDLHAELLSKEAGDTLNLRYSNDSIDLILICDRKDDIGIVVSRESIEDNLFAQKMGMMSRRHLRDLRRDAVIEYR
ncbi:MAG: peptidylprolyl isomerase [Pseudomonadota bacterium]|nr:peptidylprolyl isomerase [Pseudomonadota bacterium]